MICKGFTTLESFPLSPDVVLLSVLLFQQLQISLLAFAPILKAAVTITHHIGQSAIGGEPSYYHSL